ncbi:MAG: phytanoyl-CoA dioxygenase family protein, partial [candidate division Zixibacteria bacterium]|nr:phytanoyl-CoA dioxygenase family protein [candidate division Zixibacteria bacterium]
EALTVHRSGAIVKNVGCGYGAWHSDFSFPEHRIQHASEWLNTRDGCYSMWFYLNGTHPTRAGLAILPDSHRMDWPGPPGFVFSEGRRSFYPPDAEAKWHARMDVPGVLPLLTDPGDLIVFAERTYHGVFPHNGDEVRLSCGIAFRPGRTPYPVPWPLPDSAIAFKKSLPDTLQPLVEHYTSIHPEWAVEERAEKTEASLSR